MPLTRALHWVSIILSTIIHHMRLKEAAEHSLRGVGPDERLLGLLLLEEDSSSAEIHLRRSDIHLPLASADLVTDVEEGDREESQVRAEEGLSGRGGSRGRVESSVERGNESENVESKSEVRTSNAEGGLVGDEAEVDTLCLHTSAHADVGKADRTPDEEETETSKGQEPAKDLHTLRSGTDVGEETESDLEENTVERAALGVDVLEEAGGHVALSHGLDGSGGTESAGVGNREDSNSDDSVHDAREDLDTSILDSKNEGRGLSVGTAGTHETRVVGGEDETDDEQVEDVENGNSPENLLASHGDRSAGVGGLGSSKTNHLSTTERESSDDKDSAETLEAGESTRVLPVLDTNVALVADTTTVDDNTKDDETNTGADLDDGEHKLDLTVSSNTEELNTNESDKEDGDPDSHVDIFSPELDGDGGSDQFKGEHSQPSQSVLPTHGEAPRRIDEAADVCEEGTVDGVEDSHLSQGQACAEKHDTDDEVTDEESSGATLLKGTTRTDEETSTDGTTYEYKLAMC